MSTPSTDALGALEAASLIRPGESSGEREYRFKHTLVQETAYASLLRERRLELHRQVAEAILRVNPEAAMYQPAVLAFHYWRGGDEDRAFRFALRAGNLARRNYAHAEAAAHYDLALEIASRRSSPIPGPQLREAFLGKGSVLEVSGRHAEAVDVFRAMESFARRIGDPALEGEALVRQAASAVVTSDPAVNVEGMLERAEALARQADDRLLLARTLWNQGLRYRFLAPARADDFFHRALAITRAPELAALPPESGVRETEAHILIDLMVSGLTSGRRRMALQNGFEALSVFRELGNLPMVADALAGLSNLHQAGADFEATRNLAEEGKALSVSIDNPWGTIYNRWALLQVEADRARWEWALEEGTALLAESEQVPFLGFRLAIRSILTRTWIELGRPERAEPHARAVSLLWDEAAHPSDGWWSWARAVVGLSHLALGDIPAAAERLDPLRRLQEGLIPGFQNYYYAGPALAWLDMARGDFERGADFASLLIDRFDQEATDRYTSEMLLWRGRLRHARGASDAAATDLRRALDLLAASGARAVQWPIHAALAEALKATGDPAGARQAREDARNLLATITADLHDDDLRRSFLARPDVALARG